VKTYDHAGADSGDVRAHPWTVATGDAAFRYHDLKATPALIRTALEDFVPWSDWPAIDTFYELLEWLNGSESMLESNDCAFEGPNSNVTAGIARALEATGRVMILWRELPLNLLRANLDWLRGGIHRSLNESDREFELGAVGITVCRVRFLGLPDAGDRNLGFQLMLSFWSWGDSDDEVMANLARTIRNLSNALRAVEKEAEGLLGTHARGG